MTDRGTTSTLRSINRSIQGANQQLTSVPNKEPISEESSDLSGQLNKMTTPNFAGSGQQTAEEWDNKGISLARQGKYNDALQAFNEAIRLNSQYAPAWSNKGAVLNDLGKYNEAIQACDKAIEINPNFALAWQNKGYALQALGRTAEAEAAFAKAKELGYKG